MKFLQIIDIFALYYAIEKENLDIIKLLFTKNKLNANIVYVLIKY